MKCTSPKKISSAYQHTIPVKLNTVYAFTCPCMWQNWLFLLYHYSICCLPLSLPSIQPSHIAQELMAYTSINHL